jgi:hypothetical protein
MAIGPVQLIVLGFTHPNFHGEVIAELEKLRESDTVRVIDALAVYKDDGAPRVPPDVARRRGLSADARGQAPVRRLATFHFERRVS